AGLSPDTTGGHGGGHPGRGGASRRGGAAEPRQDAAQRIRAGARVREWEGKMNRDTVKGGGRRWRAVQVDGGAVALAAVLFGLPTLHRLATPSTALHRSDIHAEYVKVPSGRDTITAYLAYPERGQRAPAVVVIHEIFGMSDFIRQTTEQLAKDGFVAIAPDLLSRRGGTPPSPDSARKLIAGL